MDPGRCVPAYGHHYLLGQGGCVKVEGQHPRGLVVVVVVVVVVFPSLARISGAGSPIHSQPAPFFFF